MNANPGKGATSMNDTERFLESTETPALIVDGRVLETNIKDMADFAREHGVALRPHTKTHKCPEMARRQLAQGAAGIAVAKLSEAEIMAQAGITDIQIANEVVALEKLERLASLSEKVRLTIAVDNRKNALAVSAIMRENRTSIDVLMDIDIGFHRTGLTHRNPETILRFAHFLAAKPGINFRGIMTHAGQAYKCRNIQEVEKVGLFEGRRMVELADYLEKGGVHCETVSVGSTPTARFSGRVEGVTEIRPGNYIFHDVIQMSLGVGGLLDCALRVLASVSSIPTRNRVILDAGSKSLGTEKGAHGVGRVRGYGYLLDKKAAITRLSEEHGFVTNIGKGERFRLGEKLQIIPNHACFTVNLYDRIVSCPDGHVYRVEARGCSR